MNLLTAGKFALVLGAGLALASGHTVARIASRTTPNTSPRLIFWAWDEPEDMRPLAGTQAGVAFLAATVLVDDGVHVTPRMQPLSVTPETPLTAVVRVETRPGFHDTAQSRRALTEAVLDAVRKPGIQAVQVDFDATRSERAFYTAVIDNLRGGLPKNTSLSITALLSWCAHDDWIHGLSIDEAVPMYFRLGKEAHNILNGDSAYAIREPLCKQSAGIATDEPAHQLSLANKRIYVFNPRPWTAHQLQLLAQSEMP